MLITHAYSLGQKLRTPFDVEVFVTMIGYDRGGVQYYVATAGNEGAWFYEEDLRPIEA